MTTPDPEAAFLHLKEERTRSLGEEAIAAYAAGSRHIEVLKEYVRERYRAGDLEALLEHEGALKGSQTFRRIFANIKSNTQLLRHGFAMPQDAHKEDIGTLDKRAVFYMLHNSLPIDSGGYATRTHGLLRGISENGYRVTGVTRLGYPQDRGPKYANKTYAVSNVINGVGYHRNQSKVDGMGKQPLIEYLQKNLLAHMPLIRRERPAILHGASNYINGVTATFLAKRFGLKSVYEVRGLWELTRASREPEYMHSDAFRQYARMEAEACNNADHVFALTAALKDIMIERGVDGSKITILPNGVDADQFFPLPPNRDLGAELGIAEDELVIGYIGSIVDYEGIDDLLRAFQRVHSKPGIKARLLIVGDGAVLEDVKALAAELELGDRVIFTGRVPHDEVPDYYSLVDITPFPRKPLPVTEAVSPLKPFEAMAMEKCVLASNVAALDEIVIEGQNGMKFAKGDIDSFAAALETLLTDAPLRQKLARQSRTWVIEHRDWRRISTKITDVYARLLAGD
jgi:glycosyltransferase involved in cell wall biosynthesis